MTEINALDNYEVVVFGNPHSTEGSRSGIHGISAMRKSSLSPSITGGKFDHQFLATIAALALTVGALTIGPRVNSGPIEQPKLVSQIVTSLPVAPRAPFIETSVDIYKKLQNYLDGVFNGEPMGPNGASITPISKERSFFQVHLGLATPKGEVTSDNGLKTRWAPIKDRKTELPSGDWKQPGDHLDGSFLVSTARRKEDGTLEVIDWIAGQIRQDKWVFNAALYAANDTREELIKLSK